MKKSLAVMLALIMVLCMIPTTALATLDTGHKIDVRFTVLYVGDEFNIGYNYGTSEKTQFVCQYSESHSDTAYNNHSIAISDIKAAADRANVNSGYQIVGWSKEANANPTVWSLNKTGTTACNKGTTIYLVAKNPNPQPTKPTANDIPGIVGNNAVKVHCTTNNSHAEKTYGLISGSFTIGDVTKDTTSGNYTCTITVQPGEYVNAYNGTYPKHTLVEPQNHTINLKWNETDKKWVVDSALPVVFDVKCETTQPPTDEPPTKPEPENTPAIPGLTDFDAAVKVKCETVPETHKEKTFGFNWFSCKVGEVTGNEADGYTCTIEVLPGGYVDSYNALYYSGHTLVGPENYTITLNWDTANNKWSYTEGKLPVTFTVKCETVEPTVPNKPGEGVIFDLINKIKVQCIANTDPKHPEKGYDPIEGSYDVGEVSGDKEKGYTCEITVKPEKYVEEYNADVTGTNHTLAAGEGNKTVTLKYDSTNDEWKVATGMPVVFKVTCETVPEETYYIVTYTDGVGGAAFANQVQRVKRGDPTPAFNGTPSRSGYTFTGWTPAVTDTVTDNVTYTAQWKNNDNHTPGGGNGGGGHWHPTTTPVPMIVIPPKTGDMTIWQSILHFFGVI